MTRDINIWIIAVCSSACGRLFPFSNYQDVDSLVYWRTRRLLSVENFEGCVCGPLGKEDLRLWEWLPEKV